jgi:hypothetical protein
MARDDDDVTEAHDQRMTVHIITHVPEHQPREDDPHYHLFTAAKARMKRQGLWRCAINDDYCGGNVELHHTHIEFSQTNGMDLKKVNEAFGLHLEKDDEFQAWIESPGNLEPLCEVHHRTHYGVHMLPGPLWEPLRYRRQGVKPAAEFVTADEFEKGGEVDTKVVRKTTTRARTTKTGVETDKRTDVVAETKVRAGHHTVDKIIEHDHREEHQTVPRQRGGAVETTVVERREVKEKRGFFARMFGRP